MPRGADDGGVVACDGVVDVLCGEKFVEGHCYGDEDGDGDEEGECAGYDAEVTDAVFELLISIISKAFCNGFLWG